MRQRQLTHVNYRLTSHLWNGSKEKKLFLTAEERSAAVNNTNKNRRKENDVEH
jgi:hypothetical protein